MFGNEIKPKQIIIKDVGVFRALMERQYHPLLIQIECDIAKEFGLILTSAYRENDSGVHGHMRGFDNRFWCYSEITAYRIMDDINNRWEYDFERPKKQCCRIHKNRKTKGYHIHIQVHPNTRRRRI